MPGRGFTAWEWACFAGAALAMSTQFAVTTTRGCDPDELEHLHAAYCVFQGDVPYRDFFEHHSPALYYAAQPLFWFLGADLQTLWAARASMLLLSCITLVMTWRLAVACFDRAAAAIAVLLLAWSSVFVLKGTEFRPDVPACLLLTYMAVLIARRCSETSFCIWVCMGIVGGIATLFTQKAIVPVAAYSIALVVERWGSCPLQPAGQQSRTLFTLGPLWGISLGGLLVWASTAAAFGAVGGLFDLVHSVVVRVGTWPVRTDRWEQLRPSFAADATIWLGAILGGATMTTSGSQTAASRSVLRSAILMGTVSLAVVKALYPQYLLLWWPALTVLSAAGLTQIARNPSAAVRLGLVVAACGLVAGETWLIDRALREAQNSALPNLAAACRSLTVPTAVLRTIPLILAALMLVSLSKNRLPAALSCVAILGMCYGVARNVDAWLWSNRDQVDAIHEVDRLAGPQGRVLDGFTGYGPLHPHAFYFWWLNSHSQALLGPSEIAELMNNLRERPPEVVLYDADLRKLPREFREWIETHYVPTATDPVWVLRD